MLNYHRGAQQLWSPYETSLNNNVIPSANSGRQPPQNHITYDR